MALPHRASRFSPHGPGHAWDGWSGGGPDLIRIPWPLLARFFPDLAHEMHGVLDVRSIANQVYNNQLRHRRVPWKQVYKTIRHYCMLVAQLPGPDAHDYYRGEVVRLLEDRLDADTVRPTPHGGMPRYRHAFTVLCALASSQRSRELAGELARFFCEAAEVMQRLERPNDLKAWVLAVHDLQFLVSARALHRCIALLHANRDHILYSLERMPYPEPDRQSVLAMLFIPVPDRDFARRADWADGVRGRAALVPVKYFDARPALAGPRMPRRRALSVVRPPPPPMDVVPTANFARDRPGVTDLLEDLALRVEDVRLRQVYSDAHFANVNARLANIEHAVDRY